MPSPSRTPAALAIATVLWGCEAAPEANPEFSDAAQFIFRQFETSREADLAFAARTMEGDLYATLDLWAESSRDRALTPAELGEEDVADIAHPDRDPGLCVPIAVARVSPHALDAHATYPLLTNQVPVEPSSPDHYDRTFVDGTELCWPDRSCEFLRTVNDVTKDNILLTITYELKKDYRWIDFALPDPDSVPEGEEPIQEGEPRWGLVARSWSEERAAGDSGNATIEQSFSVELWVPRTGESPPDPADDSTTGTLRLLSVWAETTFTNAEFDDELVSNTTRTGIDDIFETQDAWITEGGR